MYSLPQEIEVWYVIPAIRKELAKILIEKYKLKQKKVAEILGITESAISQYLHKKRAKEIGLPKTMKKYLEIAAEKIFKDNKKVLNEIINLLNIAKKQKIICQVCKKYNKGILKICYTKPIIEK